MCKKEVDYSKLRGRIKEIFGSQEKFAIAMKKSERTISLKLNNKISFTSEEIFTAMELLNLPIEDTSHYFFNKKV